MTLKLIVKSESETKKLGETIAKMLFQGSVITLSGDLGAGKTTFTKGIGEGLNIKDDINSPTFNILKCYFGGTLNLYHIDAYRLEGVDEANKNIGLEEVIEGDGVAIIEWPNFISELIPFESLQIEIRILENGDREFTISSNAPHYAQILVVLRDGDFECIH